MGHGSDLSATSNATAAPMGPKSKECTSQDGTMDESEPLGTFFNQFFQTCKIFHAELQCMLIAVDYC